MGKENYEVLYLGTRKIMENLRRHLKKERESLNKYATILLEDEDEYIFQTADMVIKKPSHHTATKLKK
jgi:hypothetical protein